MRKLPVVNGWTMDIRLREFRKMTFDKGNPQMEFVPFSSKKGKELLAKWRKGK